ncbi:hypothetical protein AZI85_04710 [Bdellovibrio bacteriovorus]|uniref:VWFA domain-containing protein n=1 Tax=Bdellovibrio bacteriovorus TaxID=959 RepID=A0A150WIB4_BDEBC|nr:hypothetical protein [Bdellovibrio bacteriovorus]KYG63338.1 hypothetical protein AZI85_04710 [Bdellovibrio bacteriovorus]
MLLKLSKGLVWASLTAVLSLTACGPVQFSSKSAGDVDDSNVDPGPVPGGSIREVNYTNTVSARDNKLDIVLVVDDSNSMLPDNQKLAANLAPFVTKLQNSNIDWQMCATVTRALPVSSTQTAWGASIYWQSSSTASTSLGMVLQRGTSNLSQIFSNTINYINAGWVGSDDERAIKAMWRHVYNGDLRYSGNNGCYRPDSAVAYIIISDEDERSIGGDSSQQVYSGELKPLEDEDKPEVFVQSFRDTFGADRRFTVNSIIVKPGDSSCKASQDAGGAKSHYGFKYAELSQMTGGGVGSICESDFSTNLNLFLDRIQDSLSSVPLECAPVDGNITVTITPSAGVISSRIEGMNLVFDTPVPAGRTIDLKYSCPDDGRAPSSATKATPLAEQGFFAKIVSFFKNLF